MWSDRELNLFKDDLSDLINEEKLNHSAKSSTQKVLKTCQQAVDKLVEIHYELRSMQGIERRQIELIDKLKEQVKDSENLSKHCLNVKKHLEDSIDILRVDLCDSKKDSIKNCERIKQKEVIIEQMKLKYSEQDQKNQAKMTQMISKKDQEILAIKEKVEKMRIQNEELKKKVKAAESGSKHLKNALNVCHGTLTDVSKDVSRYR